jgi:hypothetical protein
MLQLNNAGVDRDVSVFARMARSSKSVVISSSEVGFMMELMQTVDSKSEGCKHRKRRNWTI